jgi:CRP-like cAMP-binding protein
LFYSAHQPIEDVIFLNGGVASLTAVLQDGTMVETATIGVEGLVGLEAFFGAAVATGDTMMQVPGSNGEFLSVGVFTEEIARRAGLFRAVQRYAQGLMALMTQSTACMAFHGVQERCCRWLLMAQDRVGGNEFLLSQEFLATMLGAARPTVTLVAGALQKAGLITYRHGRITVVDRAGLEAGSCECYATVKARFDQLGL